MNWNKTIFLAHASEDKEYVRRLYSSLKGNGLEPWLDEKNLKPGVKWDDEIRTAIKKSRFFLACLSRNSILKNGYVQRELRLALKELEEKAVGNIYFIPALIDDIEIPNISFSTVNLRDYQAIKLYEKGSFDILVDTLKQEISAYDEVKNNENAVFDNIRYLVSEGEIEESLKLLMEYVKEQDEIMFNKVLLISTRFNNIYNDSVLSIISETKYAIESNKIVYSILEIVKLLERKIVHQK